MPSLAFARESLSPALWDEITPLLVAHWREIATFQDIELSPAVDVYEASEDAGILRIFTVRNGGLRRNDGGHNSSCQCSNCAAIAAQSLVGYAIYFVRPAPHYRHSLQAVQDVLFLHPSVRGGTGYKFIAWCDEQLAAEGVQVVAQHVKLSHDFGQLLVRQGYEAVETIYVKRLDAKKERVTDPRHRWTETDETNDLNRTTGVVRG